MNSTTPLAVRSLALLTGCAGLAISAAVAQPCGSPWSSVSAGPGAYTNYGIAYDSARGKVVLYTGGNGNTWEWTAAGPGGGGSWSFVNITNPSPRLGAVMAYDSTRHKVVLFGGYASGYLNETWEYDGAAWTQIATPASPVGTNVLRMAYDPGRQRTVLVEAYPQPASTWEYDGTTWVQSPDAPGGVFSFSEALVYDAARSKMILVGPIIQSNEPSRVGTWEREASGWVLKESGTIPASGNSSMTGTFDPGRGRVLLVESSSGPTNFTVWEWDGGAAKWHVISTGGGTACRGWQAVSDEAGGQMLLFSGSAIPNNSPTVLTRMFRSDVSGGPTIADTGVRNVKIPIHAAPATLHTAASGPASYQWRFNRVNISDNASYSGTSSADLVITPTGLNLSGMYDAVVTDGCGATVSAPTQVLIDCYPNCDGSTFMPALTANDFQCFLNEFASGHTIANCDGSSVPPILNANDFQCFLNAFAAGCN